MSFTYSPSLMTDKDKLRFLLSDSDATDFIYQDEELNGLLSMESNLYFCAALALRARMASFITMAIRYRLGAAGANSGLEMDRTSIIKNITMLIDRYEAWALSQLDEVFDRFAFDIDVYGRNRSEYQGVVDATALI